MTDQTPTTEAGRRLLKAVTFFFDDAVRKGHMSKGPRDMFINEVHPVILAIEAEAREQGPHTGDLCAYFYERGRAEEHEDAINRAAAIAISEYEKGRADALREAAERVRALRREGRSDINYRAVLAILSETER